MELTSIYKGWFRGGSYSNWVTISLPKLRYKGPLQLPIWHDSTPVVSSCADIDPWSLNGMIQWYPYYTACCSWSYLQAYNPNPIRHGGGHDPSGDNGPFAHVNSYNPTYSVNLPYFSKEVLYSIWPTLPQQSLPVGTNSSNFIRHGGGHDPSGGDKPFAHVNSYNPTYFVCPLPFSKDIPCII